MHRSLGTPQSIPKRYFDRFSRLCRTQTHYQQTDTRRQTKLRVKHVIAPGAARRYAPADGSSTRGGSTSVRGRVRSPHMAKLQAYILGQLRAYGWDRQTDSRTDGGIV